MEFEADNFKKFLIVSEYKMKFRSSSLGRLNSYNTLKLYMSHKVRYTSVC